MKSVRRLVESSRWRRGTAVLALLLSGGLVLAGTGSGVGFLLGGEDATEPDLILVNGVVLTMDDGEPRARAIAITDDEISAVGSSRAVARLAGRRPDLRRRDLLARRPLARGGAGQRHPGGG